MFNLSNFWGSLHLTQPLCFLLLSHKRSTPAADVVNGGIGGTKMAAYIGADVACAATWTLADLVIT